MSDKINLPDLKKSKICIIYVYYERKNERKNESKNQTNLSYFINYGLDEKKWLNLDITTIFVINGHQCEVIIPNKENINIIHQDNCSDYEGWFNGINYITNKFHKPIYDQFDYLCLINASTCGPFMDSDLNNHWLYPFYESMIKYNSIACSPYINFFPRGSDITIPVLSCSFTLIRINNEIKNLITNIKIISTEKPSPNKYYNTILGKKNGKSDAILTGENGLSRILQAYNYNICCLYKDNHRPSYPTYAAREEFTHPDNDFLKKTIFIKNVWRLDNNQTYASAPILYDYCRDFINKQLNQKNIFHGLSTELNYDLLNISLGDKKGFYNTFGFAEEYTIFPKKIINNNGVVIYAHYDSKNIISDYVIQGLKSLIYIGYDILFYTASSSLNNVDINTFPFSVIFLKNEGAGTDWTIWLDGLRLIKSKKLNYKWVMFMNCSILFPINGLKNCKLSIDNMRETSDFWGHWLSRQINVHLIGSPIEFKYELIDDIDMFIENNLKKCKNKEDYINYLEVKLTNYLINKNYKMNAIIKYTDLPLSHIGICPLDPRFLKIWINHPNTFAIKWKYIISYLSNNVVSQEFNYLTKYLHYGPYGTIGPVEAAGGFPSSLKFQVE